MKQDGHVIVPGSGAAPLSGPKGTISRSMHLLKTDHMRLYIAKEAEYKSATRRGGHAFHVKGQDLKRNHRGRKHRKWTRQGETGRKRGGVEN